MWVLGGTQLSPKQRGIPKAATSFWRGTKPRRNHCLARREQGTKYPRLLSSAPLYLLSWPGLTGGCRAGDSGRGGLQGPAPGAQSMDKWEESISKGEQGPPSLSFSSLLGSFQVPRASP